MPHKFNAARRHKFDKAQYRVINWAEYNESLRQRGDLTIWVSDEAQSMWSAPRRTSRGGQRRYSDLAIETCLTLRTAYRLGLRQTQGLMGSIGTLMGLDIRVPDYSTLSRRANGLSIVQVMRQAGSVPVHLVVDSTGLKIFGEGEWLAQKHKIKGIRRRWRKLHLGLDLHSGTIVCANLTHDDVGDSTALPGLLDQLDAPVTGFLADGAYDKGSAEGTVWGDPGCGYTTAKERRDPPAIGAGSNRSGSPYCPDPQQRPHGLASGHRVQPAQPDRNADRPLEGCHRPQTPIPQLLQANHGDPGRPKSPEHNDRTRTACVRTYRLTLRLGERGNSISAPIHATTLLIPTLRPSPGPLLVDKAQQLLPENNPKHRLDAIAVNAKLICAPANLGLVGLIQILLHVASAKLVDLERLHSFNIFH